LSARTLGPDRGEFDLVFWDQEGGAGHDEGAREGLKLQPNKEGS
jgi:hypothetical protein